MPNELSHMFAKAIRAEQEAAPQLHRQACHIVETDPHVARTCEEAVSQLQVLLIGDTRSSESISAVVNHAQSKVICKSCSHVDRNLSQSAVRRASALHATATIYIDCSTAVTGRERTGLENRRRITRLHAIPEEERLRNSRQQRRKTGSNSVPYLRVR